MAIPSPRMSPTVVVVILSLLLGIQPIATDLYLPALPAITAELRAPMPQAQLTLTALLLAFGVSQLVWGPLSDRFGRRPVVLAGSAAFALAALGSVFATDMHTLIGWRTVQGIAMGAAVVCARAIVRDLYAPTEGARVMSKGLTGLGILACASAPLGGALSDLFGWQATLAALAAFGVLSLAVVALRFEETLPPTQRTSLRPGVLLSAWVGIARHPTFWAYALLATASYAGLFTFLATSSFVFIKDMGLGKTTYGLLMLSMSFVYIVGTVLCRALLPRIGVRRTVACAAGFTLVGGTLLGVLAWAGVQNTWAIMGPYYLFIVAHGVHQPCGQSGAVSPFPQTAGAASALSGFLIMVVAFVMGGWIGRELNGAPTGAAAVTLAQGLWLWSVVIATVAWTLVWRFGEPRQPPVRSLGQHSAP